jgi:predicted phosphodiesterase
MRNKGHIPRLLFAVVVLLAILSLAQCGSTVSAGRDPDLKRGPYVQLGRTDSILIIWQTVAPSIGGVEYGLTTQLGKVLKESEVGTTHALSISGLEAKTTYSYRITAYDHPLIQPLTFHTNHGPSDTGFTFLAFGDSGSGSDAQLKVASLINSSGAELAIHTGDVVYEKGEEENYDSRFFLPYASFLASHVLYPSLGNHDLVTDNGAPYLNNFFLPANNPGQTERYYSFDYGNAHFVALDTNQAFDPTSAQYQWLEQDLAATQQFWKFVFFHQPPYSASSFSSPGVRQHLVPLFERFGVDIVFAGHTHAYERTFPLKGGQSVDTAQEPNYDDVSAPIYVVTGGGGGPLHEVGTGPLYARNVSAYHFTQVQIEDSRLTVRAIKVDGTIFDQFSLRK